MKKNFLLGNAAIALGLLESKCEIITAYPGTPSSEIIPEVLKLIKSENLNTYIEWSINEKTAFDNAFAAAISGKRAACCMKQVGLNVASDSLVSSAYLGTKGGFIIISCDDPGPHSSQTEQDSRLMAKFAKIPVLDPSLPEEARKMIKYAFNLSEKFEIPIIIRPTTRICHSKEIISWKEINNKIKKAKFHKNPTRWAATPKYRLKQHKNLNIKLSLISKKFDKLKQFNYHNLKSNKQYQVGIITSGFSSSIVSELLTNKKNTKIAILKLGSVFPLPKKIIETFIKNCKNILVIEETDNLIEILLPKEKKIFGRLTGHIPKEGELLPKKIENIINKFLSENKLTVITKNKKNNIFKKIENLKLPEKKPSLCSGCPHRATFFAIRKSEPKAIYTSDIGCYTLGMNMGSVDTCIDMGAAITIASGFYQSFKKDKKKQPIIATIGDSTFLHSGTTGLINAVYNNSRFLLIIMDNGTIAMTGMQPSPTSGILANKKIGIPISLEKLVKGCGVNFIETIDPYDVKKTINLVKYALNYSNKPNGGISVIIARHPCLVAFKNKNILKTTKYIISSKCNKCNYCHKLFQCPSINKCLKSGKTFIDQHQCVKCGVCINICPNNAIIKKT